MNTASKVTDRSAAKLDEPPLGLREVETGPAAPPIPPFQAKDRLQDNQVVAVNDFGPEVVAEYRADGVGMGAFDERQVGRGVV